jgi:uncharacterized protein (DUF2141 family)
MKKNIYLICILLLSLISFNSCEKDPSCNGNLIVTVQYHSQPVVGAKVYLKQGYYVHPNFTDSQFDAILTTNSSGTAEFADLVPGRYYLKAVGAAGTTNQMIQTDTIANVLRRFRGDNTSDFTIVIP